MVQGLGTYMDSWTYRCEGTEEAVLSLTEHGDEAVTVQGGPDSKELDRWTLAPVERGWFEPHPAEKSIAW